MKGKSQSDNYHFNEKLLFLTFYFNSYSNFYVYMEKK